MPGAAISMFGLEHVPKIAFLLFKLLHSDPTNTESMQRAEDPESGGLLFGYCPFPFLPLGTVCLEN